jgi:hypothetical protein
VPGIDQLIEWAQEFVGTHTHPLQLPDGQSVPPTGRQIRMRWHPAAPRRDPRTDSLHAAREPREVPGGV